MEVRKGELVWLVTSLNVAAGTASLRRHIVADFVAALHVTKKVAVGGEADGTQRTGKGTLSRMRQHVALEGSGRTEKTTASVTLITSRHFSTFLQLVDIGAITACNRNVS